MDRSGARIHFSMTQNVYSKTHAVPAFLMGSSGAGPAWQAGFRTM